MVLPAGREHAPHTQTAKLLMEQPCFGTTAGTDTAGPAGNREEILLSNTISQKILSKS